MNWPTIQAIFDHIITLPFVERAAYLTQACGADAALRAEVEKLLRAHDSAGSNFLKEPAIAHITNLTEVLESDAPAPMSSEEQRIGAYRIVRQLGEGGMGAVFLAERADGAYEKSVAIKLMRAGLGAWEIERFKKERQMLAKLDHPNIARLLDGGTHNGLPYAVMEWVEGESLRTVLKRSGVLTLDLVLTLVRQLAAGLAAAHELGIVHRDIKPENLMIERKGEQWLLKILDFGIARAPQQTAGENQTQTGLVMGTAHYMSPEQARGATGEKIDQRSDIYSVGMVVYEMLAGQTAFAGDSFNDVVAKHIYEPPPSLVTAAALRTVTPTSETVVSQPVTSEIEQVVFKALAKKRDQRHKTVIEFADELETAIQQPKTDLYRTTQGEQPVPQYNDKAELHDPAQTRPLAVAPVQARITKRVWLSGAALLLATATGWAIWTNGSRPFAGSSAGSLVDAAKNEPPAVTAPAAAATIQFSVWKRPPRQAERAFALATEGVTINDELFMQLTPPFACTVYWLYEEREGELVWANPQANQMPQIAAANQRLRVPAQKGIEMGEGTGKESFLVLYVPSGVNWSLDDIVAPALLKVDAIGGNIPYAMLDKKAAQRLRAFLQQNAVLLPTRVGGATATMNEADLPANAQQVPPRILYHRVELFQTPLTS